MKDLLTEADVSTQTMIPEATLQAWREGHTVHSTPGPGWIETPDGIRYQFQAVQSWMGGGQYIAALRERLADLEAA